MLRRARNILSKFLIHGVKRAFCKIIASSKTEDIKLKQIYQESFGKTVQVLNNKQ